MKESRDGIWAKNDNFYCRLCVIWNDSLEMFFIFHTTECWWVLWVEDDRKGSYPDVLEIWISFSSICDNSGKYFMPFHYLMTEVLNVFGFFYTKVRCFCRYFWIQWPGKWLQSQSSGRAWSLTDYIHVLFYFIVFFIDGQADLNQ